MILTANDDDHQYFYKLVIIHGLERLPNVSPGKGGNMREAGKGRRWKGARGHEGGRKGRGGREEGG